MNRHKFENNNLDVDITLFRNEITYDVDFASNRIARVILTDEEIKKGSLISTESTSSDSKVDYIDRCITHALSTVRQKLQFAVNPARPHLRTGICNVHHRQTDVDNLIPTGDQSFSMSFSFEEGWHGSAQLLCNFIHSFVVNSILSDWFQLTMPDQAALFKAKANDDLQSLVHEGRSVTPVGVQTFYI